MASVVSSGGDDDDPLRTYTPAEEKKLTENLLALTGAIHRGELRERAVDIPLLQDLHASLFQRVRDHAGHLRAPGFGQEHVIFGPHRSAHRKDVKKELERIFDAARKAEALLEPSSEAYEFDFLHLAVRLHADIIRVHPFEDGNGRTGRLICSHMLVRHGLRPIAVEAVKQDYTDCLNHYYRGADIQPLVDLFLRLDRSAGI